MPPGFLLALDVDQPHDAAVDLGDELDARPLPAFLLTVDGVVIGRIEEGEDPAVEPALLVGVGIRADDLECFHDQPAA